MEFIGKLIEVLEPQSGTSKAGNAWRKQGWVFETFGQYPRKVKGDAMNAALDSIGNLQLGKTYTVSFDLESREYMGKWYTDVRIFRAVEGAEPAPQGMASPQAPAQAPASPFGGNADPFGGASVNTDFSTPDNGEDLPF